MKNPSGRKIKSPEEEEGEQRKKIVRRKTNREQVLDKKLQILDDIEIVQKPHRQYFWDLKFERW